MGSSEWNDDERLVGFHLPVLFIEDDACRVDVWEQAVLEADWRGRSTLQVYGEFPLGGDSVVATARD